MEVVRCRSASLHEEEISGLLDHTRYVALLQCSQTRNAARKNLSGIRYKAGQDFHIGMGQIQWVLLACFLSRHRGLNAMLEICPWQEKFL